MSKLENVLPLFDLKDVDESNCFSDCSIACAWLLDKVGPRKVIEIGTSYGKQLMTFVPKSSITYCIDPMYNWVPDISDAMVFDPKLVDQEKVGTWRKHAEPAKDKVELIFANSFHVVSEGVYNEKLKGAEILIIDGCHHPADLVYKDYENFMPLLASTHYVLWDDANLGDVGVAIQKQIDTCRAAGFQVERGNYKNCTMVWINKG